MTRGAASETQTPSPSWAARTERWQSLGGATACILFFACTCAVGCHKQARELVPDGGPGSTFVRLASHAANARVVTAAVAPVGPDPIPPHTLPPLTAREKVGQSILLDTNLSNPPGTGCASCHDPAGAFSGNNGSITGVARGSRPGHFGRRNTPSVMYLKYVPPFHFALEDDDDIAESPFGGLSWSGRADTIAEFARLPLLDADEMNNRSEAEIAVKLRTAAYAADLAREFPGALESPASAMKALGEALQAFLTSETMSPFTSKFDDFLRGKAQLSPLETKGLKAFENRQKGACNHCHLMYEHATRPDSSLFTTYSYDAVGVPGIAPSPPMPTLSATTSVCASGAEKGAFVRRAVVRLVSNPIASQRGGSPEVHAQRSLFEASRRRGLLCDSIDEP